eukprot:713894-Pyramimonas_sp.AAC.1
MIGGGTLIDAIILANQINPNNPHVKYVKEKGVPDTIEFKYGTPIDVLKWVRVQANQYHDGSDTTIAELYEECSTLA